MIRHIAFATSAIALVAITPAQAGPYNGTWLRPSTGAHIKAFDCGGGLGLKVVKSDKASTVGKSIICGAKPAGNNAWSGTGNKVDDGAKFKGTWTLKGSNTLQVKGCLTIGFPCRTENWKRVN